MCPATFLTSPSFLMVYFFFSLSLSLSVSLPLSLSLTATYINCMWKAKNS